MKDIFSAFGSEVFRPLVTIVIPGAMAITVWFIALLQKFARLRAIADANHTETIFLLTLASIAVGLLVEDFGSRIEKRFDEWLVAKPGFALHRDEWKSYWRVVFKAEPIGQRYLNTILLRFKFELGTAIALLFAATGLLFTTLSLCSALAGMGVALLAAYLLMEEGRSSHRLLSEIRHEILKGAIPYPADAPPAVQN